MNTQQAVDTSQLRAQYASALGEAKKLADQWKGKEHEMPSEVATQISGWLGTSDELKARLDVLGQLNTGIRDMGEPITTPVISRPAAPGEGDVPTDPQSWKSFDLITPFGTKEYRFNTPLATGRDAKSARAYSTAFDLYCRLGEKALQSRYPSDYKALSEGTDTAGGFLIPQDFQAVLLKKLATMVAVRAYARVIQTQRESVVFARVNYTTDNKYTSPARVTWTGETPATSTAHQVTDQTFGQITIPVNVAMASQLISNSLIEDAGFDVISYVADCFAEAFALDENDAFLNGTGVARPYGIMTRVTDGTISNTVSGTSAAISTSGDAWSGKRLIDLYYAHPSQYRMGAMWLMNSTTMAAVENLVDAQKRPLIKELQTASIAMGEPSIIKGKAVAIDEFMPDIGASTYPILFGQMTGYTIVDRVGYSLQRASELYMQYDQTLLVGRKRVGGDVTEAYRFRALKASA